MLWLLGLITFWTTRVSAIFDLFFTLELLLSGRLVPLELMPGWAQNIAAWLPFQWAFGFPIEVLIGRLAPEQIGRGFGIQVVWIVVSYTVIHLVWKRGIKHFTAVGG
jgi:ABC-2 type transport system permease protein